MTYRVVALKRVLARNDGGVWGEDPTGEADTVVLRSTEQSADGFWKIEDPACRSLSPVERAKARLCTGDLLVTKSSGSALHIGKTTIVTPEVAELKPAYSNFMQRLRLLKISDPVFYWYCLRSSFVREQVNLYSTSSTGLANLTSVTIGELIVPTPEFRVQRQIADYLDVRTAKVDVLIEKQERLIETLAERRQAVISHAVTKGLDLNAPMKDSGVALIGQIPSHWVTLPLKRLISKMEQGVSPVASAELADESSWGVVKSGCVNRGVFSDMQHKRLASDFEIDFSIAIHEGDLLVSRASGSPALVGSAAIVRQLRYQLILSDKTFRLVVNSGSEPTFIEKVMNSRLFREQVLGAISGAEGLANNLPSSSLKQFNFPVPPKQEQAAIVRHLDRETTQIDALSGKAREMIGVLKERRQALISAAVTGKIDVRGLS